MEFLVRFSLFSYLILLLLLHFVWSNSIAVAVNWILSVFTRGFYFSTYAKNPSVESLTLWLRSLDFKAFTQFYRAFWECKKRWFLPTANSFPIISWHKYSWTLHLFFLKFEPVSVWPWSKYYIYFCWWHSLDFNFVIGDPCWIQGN